jgi:hypothetical protein
MKTTETLESRMRRNREVGALYYLRMKQVKREARTDKILARIAYGLCLALITIPIFVSH